MNGQELKTARKEKRWTQQKTAAKLGVTQAYLSMLERGLRSLPLRLARKAAGLLDAPATTLPLREDPVSTAAPALRDFPAVPRDGSERVRRELASLGYPGFAHLPRGPKRNPAEVLLHGLNEDHLESRVTEGLPWLALHYPNLDWEWLVERAKLRDRQNRLGFVTTLASQLAEQAANPARKRLSEYVGVLERSRLVREDTLCHESLTAAERNWLRVNRPAEAAHWNLLTDMRVENLVHATS
jgi:transcriptional regulator with XRE-family HTH domain